MRGVRGRRRELKDKVKEDREKGRAKTCESLGHCKYVGFYKVRWEITEGSEPGMT